MPIFDAMRGIFVGALLIFVVMVLIKDGRLFHRHGSVTGGCHAVAAPVGDVASWQACRAGKLDTAPDLSRFGCTSVRVEGKTTYWRCPARIQGGPGS